MLKAIGQIYYILIMTGIVGYLSFIAYFFLPILWCPLFWFVCYLIKGGLPTFYKGHYIDYYKNHC
jgi:hypothetical protein